jgi:hypothetical protein
MWRISHLWGLYFFRDGQKLEDPFLFGGISMRRFSAALLVLGLASLNTRDAAAQPSSQDIAAAGAIALTPVGTFAHHVMTKGWDAKGKYGLAGRYGMLSPKTGESNSSIGATGSMGLGMNAIVSGTLGYTLVGCPTGATCDNGILVGADVLSSLWNSTGTSANTMHLKLQGSLGYSAFGDGNALSAVVGVPFVWVMHQGGGSGSRAVPQARSSGNGRFSLFASPGFGWGRMDNGSANESGTRPIVSAGGEYVTANGMGFHIGYTHIVIEDAAKIFGLGMTFNFGGPATTR